ncbi:hypothetical protein QQY66_47225 [Streptomyces sp. DG2A-72]|uniref:hypothetical protein n=1 Tax=Streptomyces sp. DG2A-72 TaxID=3051386 RepID=UPI00265C7D94|nr:hypothetical protein [Streptomyces sp. DG2A-72]MDO0938945.1 hypothetical protein [Streptomyces sp. DG2A-72]
MPAVVIEEPLAVRFVLRNGSTWTARLAGLPNPQLARDLAVGLAGCAHPHGGIGAENTAQKYAVSVRQMVKKLATMGFAESAGDLTKALLLRYWMAGTHERECDTRIVLKALDDENRCLRPEVRALLEGHAILPHPPVGSYEAYTDDEWERMHSACRTVVEESRHRQREILKAAEAGQDPRASRRHSEADIAHLLLRDGPMSGLAYVEYIKGYVRRRPDGPAGSYAALRWVREALFPTPRVQTAYRLLFGMYSGLVPDGIADLELGDIEWAGDSTVLLSYYKGRSGPEGATPPREAVRLLQRWLTHAEPLRRFAPEELRQALWIACEPHGVNGVLGLQKNNKPQRDLIRHLNLLDDWGARLEVNRSRIRTTYEERLARRGWTGRTTIDPNHTSRTEGDHYVTPTTPAQLEAVESIIEDGQADVLRKALPPVVLSSETAAKAARAFPEAVRRLELDEGALAELLGGERDVFTAACADQLAGLHGPKGKPCPARPWVCLLCPLALFLPRHSANLLRLKAFFARQFRQMPIEQFLRSFGPYADRLDNEILPKLAELSQTAVDRARLEVADDDTELPLRPEEISA